MTRNRHLTLKMIVYGVISPVLYVEDKQSKLRPSFLS